MKFLPKQNNFCYNNEVLVHAVIIIRGDIGPLGFRLCDILTHAVNALTLTSVSDKLHAFQLILTRVSFGFVIFSKEFINLKCFNSKHLLSFEFPAHHNTRKEPKTFLLVIQTCATLHVDASHTLCVTNL